MKTETQAKYEPICRQWENEIYRTKHEKIVCEFNEERNQFFWDWVPSGQKGQAPLEMLQSAIASLKKEMSFEQREKRDLLAPALAYRLHDLSLSQLTRIQRICEEEAK